ncbi:hypothetical protein BGZ52_012368 [Haplosporangium bisporale]|nr:hypothetical protein BGZ52_012368 [Haplosporangium bisporale]
MARRVDEAFWYYLLIPKTRMENVACVMDPGIKAKDQQPPPPTAEEALWVYDENLIDMTTPGEIDPNNNGSVYNLAPIENESSSRLVAVKKEHPCLTKDSLNTTTKGDSDMLLFRYAHMARDDDLVSFNDEPSAPVIMHESPLDKKAPSPEAYKALLAFEQDLLTIAVAHHIDPGVSKMAEIVYKTLFSYKFLNWEYPAGCVWCFDGLI